MRAEISSASSGTITIMNAWAVADPPIPQGHPYRDAEVRLVCTLCGSEIATCDECGKRFTQGQSLRVNGCCAEIDTTPEEAERRSSRSWWQRLLERRHLRAPRHMPMPERQTKWVAVAGRPHMCVIGTCQGGSP